MTETPDGQLNDLLAEAGFGYVSRIINGARLDHSFALHPYATSDGRVFRRSVSAIQLDDDCSLHPMPPSHHMHTLVAPLSVYPPQHPDFGSSYGMVHHTPPSSLFATGPSGSGHHVDDESEEDDDEADALVRRNPPRNRRAPDCGTEGHKRH
ncbi:hypothetical protein V6N13_033836 [Hibiscus sabdariffa]